MLKQRIITAIILLPIFIALILFISDKAFFFLTGAFMLWGAWEWSSFMGVNKAPLSFIYPIVILILMGVAAVLHTGYILGVSFIWWLFALLLVFMYPKGSARWGKGIIPRAIMGILVLIPCWLALNFIRRAEGPYILLFLFILIWGADTGAYFAGRKWGKYKLAPLVSPGKTVEGLVGALLVTSIVVIGAILVMKIPDKLWLPIAVLSFVTVLFSVLGDLFESMLKRNVGLKDSGHLLPGHGGLLDRIDSLTAAAPIFALGGILIVKYFY